MPLRSDSQAEKDTLSRESRLRKLAEKKEQLQLEREAVASKLEKLDYKIIQTQAEYGALYNETAPLLNLPTEIFCRIFEAAHDASFVEGVPYNPLIEVIISHVCRAWRSIALSFPPLWSTYWYDASKWPERNPLYRLIAYLARSGSHLLDLHFTFAQSVLGDERQAVFNTMLEITVPHVARWRRFSLSSDGDVPILAFGDRLRELEAPNLEYFAMCPNTDNWPEGLEDAETLVLDGLSPTAFLGGAPKLFYVRLDATCPSKYFPPLSNITVLRLEDETLEPDIWSFGSYGTFLEILALPSLSSLSIVGQHFSEPDLPHSSKIPMNNLKHLRYAGEYNLIGHFLPFLVAPLLETLIISNATLPPPPSPLPKFMRPFSNLHSLELIECLDFDVGFVNSLAALTPHVTHLTIADSSVSDSILQHIGELFVENGTKLWPKVKVLTALLFDGDDIDPYIDFARMIENRELIIRTSESIVDDWRVTDLESPQLLEAICILEQIPAGKKLVSWPPGIDVPAEEDFFTIEY